MAVASRLVNSDGKAMSDLWKSWAGAPLPGNSLCSRSDIPEGGTLCLVQDEFPIVLVRKGDRISAYVNACPHQYLPLNHRGEKLLSADGAILRCSNHNAGFASDTGEGVEGLGIGACLDAIPILIDQNEQIVVCEADMEVALASG